MQTLLTVLFLIAFFLTANEIGVAFRASRTGARAMTQDLDGLADLWPEYDRLSQRSYLRVGIMNLERVLTRRVEALTGAAARKHLACDPVTREFGRT